MTKIVKQAKIWLHLVIVYRSSSPSPKIQLANMSTPPLFSARLFMILWRVITHFPELQVQEIADFNGHQPEQIQSPAGAKRW